MSSDMGKSGIPALQGGEVQQLNPFLMEHTMNVESRLTYDSVRYDQDTDLHLVVSLTAPTIDWQAKRPSICVIPILDCSGSMEGDKLAYAKQSAIKLLEHLKPGDYCGLVSFASDVQVHGKPREVTQAYKEELKAAIGKLRTRGGTNLAAGMLAGLEQVSKLDVPANMIIRAMLFTDGQPTEGVATLTPDLVSLLNKNKGRATLSAFGYGAGADQVLLGELAKEGAGNYAFVKDPEDALTAFGKELGGLLSTYAQDIEIQVFPHGGNTLIEVVSDVDVDDSPDAGGKLAPEPAAIAKIKLPNILSEETRHVVMAVKLAKQDQPGQRTVTVFDVVVGYDLLEDSGKKTHCSKELKPKVGFVREGDEQKKPTAEVDKIVAMHQMVQKQIEAEGLANAGNYDGAAGVMAFMTNDATARGHAQVSYASSVVGNTMGSHARYHAGAGMLRSMAVGMTRGMGSSSYDHEAEAMLGDMGVQVNTSATSAVAISFAGEAEEDLIPHNGPLPVPTGASNMRVEAVKLVEPPKALKKSKSKKTW